MCHDSCICSSSIYLRLLYTDDYVRLSMGKSLNRSFVTWQPINQKSSRIAIGHDLRSPQFTIRSIDANICSSVTYENIEALFAAEFSVSLFAFMQLKEMYYCAKCWSFDRKIYCPKVHYLMTDKICMFWKDLKRGSKEVK